MCKQEQEVLSPIFVDPVLYAGVPENLADRSETERTVYEKLDALGIAYKRADHGPAMTIADCHLVDAVLGVAMCKNLFLCNAQKTNFYLLLMPGEKPFRTKDLSKQINSARLSFAGAEFMQEYLHISPGAVSVMGLLFDTEKHVRLLIDSDLLKEEYLGCHPCENTSSIRFATRDLTEKILPALGIEPVIVHRVGHDE